MLWLLASLPEAHGQQRLGPSPVATVDLHTNAEWRVNAPIEFDPTGRLLILYRDKFKLRPSGNWHLIRLADPLSAKPLREEITFSIPQEPVNPRAADRWIGFHSHLLLSADGRRAYATFSGTVVTAKPGPRLATGGENVKVGLFSSVASFDLRAFRLLACAEVELPPTPDSQRVDAEGNLLLLSQTDTDWTIAALDESLRKIKAVIISMAPVSKGERFFCQLRPDYMLECPASGGGDPVFILGPQSTVQLPRSACKRTSGPGPLEFGRDETVVNGIVQSARLCIRNDSGQEERVASDPLTRCYGDWRPDVISPDHRSLLVSCSEVESFLDMFFTSKVTLQLVDALTLASRATIPLSTRRRSTYTVFHHSGTTTIAVLEDGWKLALYNLTDQRES
jgi:hypothetical protein